MFEERPKVMPGLFFLLIGLVRPKLIFEIRINGDSSINSNNKNINRFQFILQIKNHDRPSGCHIPKALQLLQCQIFATVIESRLCQEVKT